MRFLSPHNPSTLTRVQGPPAARWQDAPGGSVDDASRRAEESAGPGDAAEIDSRVASLLPPQLLQPNEIIILLLKPSLWFIILPCLGFLIGTIALAVLAIALRNAGHLAYLNRQDIVLCAMGIAGIRIFWQFLEWLSRFYVLTDQRIVRIKGVLRVQVFETQIKQIQHTETVFSLKERIVGVGTLLFATAGTASIEAAWQMVAQPLEVHRIVVQAIQRYGR